MKSSLAILLSKLSEFERPSQRLEQYATEPEIAAEMCHTAMMRGDIKGKVIADLGAGTGRLGIGSLILGASRVFFVEVSDRAVEKLKKNIKIANELISKSQDSGKPGLGNIIKNAKILQCDVRKFNQRVDTVLMNPPFGIRRKHADRIFLEKAFEISQRIYSIHKLESKVFLEKMARRFGFSSEFAQKKLRLARSMSFHKKKSVSIDVVIAIFSKINVR